MSTEDIILVGIALFIGVPILLGLLIGFIQGVKSPWNKY